MLARKGFLISALLVIMLCIMSACGLPGASASTGQVLQNSINAMKQLKTAHIDMTFADSVQIPNLATSNTSNSKVPTAITVKMQGGGDEVMPDQASMHFTMDMGSAGKGLKIAEIVKGKQLYIQNSKGQWYVLDQSALQGSSGTGNLFGGANAAQYNQLIALAQKAHFTDHGTETLNGQSLRHITATFGKDVLKDLLNALGQTPKGMDQQALNKLLSQIQVKNAALDLWIDEGTSYVHRMEMKFQMVMNLGSFATPTTTSQTGVPTSITSNIDTLIDYSKFNDSITINAPANAI
ncbi:MAG: hypothetical protein M3Z08_11175, partial [Chloroflexota bacterium]|nr:hypothetical protein [Chloroflexota bacterium]